MPSGAAKSREPTPTSPECWQELVAGKLNPPTIDPVRHLPRRRLLRQVQESPPRKITLIEARAGQGKSIFAAQLIANTGIPYCWYQIGAEDQDPIVFVSGLLHGLRQRLPAFEAPQLTHLLRQGDGVHEPSHLATLLLRELQPHLPGKFCFVLDDIYLLEGASGSLGFIQTLLQTTSPHLSFILVSRHPVSLLVQDILPKGEVERIDNTALAFTPREVADLCNDMLHLPACGETVRLLHRLTEGWVMGLILAGQSLPPETSVTEDALLSALREIPQGGLLDYFLTTVFPRFSKCTQLSLLIFSLLDTIPVMLAEELAAGEESARELLIEMCRRNLFVRPLDVGGEEYVLHHLFHHGLRTLAWKQLASGEIERTHRVAAGWYRQQDRPVEALHHLLVAEDYAGAAELLKELGLELLAKNRLTTLHLALSRIPTEAVRHYAWLAYFTGITTLDIDPPEALSFFESAQQRFLFDGEELGELLTLVSLISYHIIVDGRLHLGANHIRRAADLFERHGEKLPPVHQAHAANILLLAFSNILNDFSGATTYYDIGLRTAQLLQMKNLEAESRLMRCYWHIFSGDVKGSFAEIEKAMPLLRSPLITPLYKGSLYLAWINILANTGDHASYRYHSQRFRTLLGGDVFDHSILAAYSNQWAIDMALFRGDFQESRELLLRQRTADFAGAGPHLRCQTMQYTALVAALTGDRAEALSAAEESLRLRREVGCPLFIANNCGIIGGAYALIGEAERALGILQEGLEHAQSVGDFYARATLHAYRAWLHLEMGERTPARRDLSDLLDCLHRYGHGHFYGWHPQLMQRLLTVAVREGIRSDFARQLARRHLDLALLDDGTPLPLLHVCTLGGLSLQIGNRTILRGEDLTPHQRQLLTLLLAGPGLHLSQEEITGQLWPDSPEHKARKNFDALLIRLRKTLSEAVGSCGISHPYLVIRKGVLGFEHTLVDALILREAAAKALRHQRDGEPMQADNAFRRVAALWNGPFMASLPLPESAESFRQELSLLYLKCVRSWCPLLTADGRHAEAEEIAVAALRFDPINEDLVRLLHGIYTTRNNPVKARQLLEAYARALSEATFSDEEIEEILEAFWTHPA